jgi:hypothetical protein
MAYKYIGSNAPVCGPVTLVNPSTNPGPGYLVNSDGQIGHKYALGPAPLPVVQGLAGRYDYKRS